MTNLKEQTVYIPTKDCKVKGDTYDLFEIDDVTEVHNQIILSKDELTELLGNAWNAAIEIQSGYVGSINLTINNTYKEHFINQILNQ